MIKQWTYLMRKKINRLSLILEHLERYFQKDGHLILWNECKDKYRQQEYDSDIRSLEVNDSNFSLTFMEQFEPTELNKDGWITSTITLEDYYRKRFVELLNWSIPKLKSQYAFGVSKIEINEYYSHIDNLDKLAQKQSSLSYAKDLILVLGNYKLFDNKSTKEDEAIKFLVSATIDEAKIETLYNGLIKLGFINCNLSLFNKIFIKKEEGSLKKVTSKSNIVPIEWLVNKGAFGYFFQKLAAIFKVEGYKNGKVTHALWLFADNTFYVNSEKAYWSKDKETRKARKYESEIDTLFEKISDQKN